MEKQLSGLNAALTAFVGTCNRAAKRTLTATVRRKISQSKKARWAQRKGQASAQNRACYVSATPSPELLYFRAMTDIDSYKPGSFCWVELGTTDQNAAKRFYGELFGWVANDMPMGPEGVYTIFKLNGRDAAAGYTLRQDQRARGVPPHWILYVTVESADAKAGQAAKAGGTVLAGPFDVMDVGRMAVLTDPTGAAFCVWQAKGGKANGLADVDGTLCWADLNTPDPDRAGKFYGELFGWKFTKDTDDDPPSGYLHIQNGGDFIGGLPPVTARSSQMPAHWLPYFQISNCDATAAKARQLGAKFYLDPMTLEDVGRFAVLADPQGAVFAIFQSGRKG